MQVNIRDRRGKRGTRAGAPAVRDRALPEHPGSAQRSGMAPDPGSVVGPARVDGLDGIRGWAALMVVVYHVFYETMGAAFPDFRTIGFRMANGSFAVFIFFVLSGEALSASFLAGGGVRAIASLAVKRHSRLSIPVLASVLVVFALQRGHLVFSGEAAPLVGRQDWLGQAATAPVSLAQCVRYALWEVYLPKPVGPDIIPFLWTMSAEMMGSIFIFALLPVWHSLRNRSALLIGLAAFLVASFGTGFLGAFVAGVLFGQARHDGTLARWRRRRGMAAASGAAILVVPLLVGLRSIEDKRFQAIAAVLLLGAIYLNRPAMAFFGSWPSRMLGKLSFPLYLIHFSVLVSVTSGLIVAASRRGLLDEAHAVAIGLVSVAAALGEAVLFDPVERLTKAIGQHLATTFVQPRGWA